MVVDLVAELDGFTAMGFSFGLELTCQAISLHLCNLYGPLCNGEFYPEVGDIG